MPQRKLLAHMLQKHPRGAPKLQWKNPVRYDTTAIGMEPTDLVDATADRYEWRMKTHVEIMEHATAQATLRCSWSRGLVLA